MSDIREIVFDTETTGLKPEQGDRIVEIASIEMVNMVPTGKTWHTYINPERDMPIEAERIHGISGAFLLDKPVFAKIAPSFLEWIGNSRLVAHNAQFDISFLNAELGRLGYKPLQNEVVDTVTLARRRFPGGKASLDDLCRRFHIDLSRREKHGAIIDTELLAQVYVELLGGRNISMDFGKSSTDEQSENIDINIKISVTHRPIRASRNIGGPTDEEVGVHKFFIEKIKNSLWSQLATIFQEHGHKTQGKKM